MASLFRRAVLCNRLQHRQLSAVLNELDLSSYSFGPSVRLLLNLYNISPTQVAHTGPHNRLLKGDVLSYISNNGLEPQPFQSSEAKSVVVSVLSHATTTSKPPKVDDHSRLSTSTQVLQHTDDLTDISLSELGQATASRLLQSKSNIPHGYLSITCDIDPLRQLIDNLSKDNVLVSIRDFVVKAAAAALSLVPQVNQYWDGMESRAFPSIDIAVKVWTDQGTITPVVMCANEKTADEIAQEIQVLVGEGHTSHAAATLTVTDLSDYGVTDFTTIIDAPQSCALSVGGIQLSLGNSGRLTSSISLTLSYDCRIVDETVAGDFLAKIKRNLELLGLNSMS